MKLSKKQGMDIWSVMITVYTSNKNLETIMTFNFKYQDLVKRILPNNF